ncbi:MAG: hypothetical protein RLZZ502_625, partial [Pseudomonadota bacterium]
MNSRLALLWTLLLLCCSINRPGFAATQGYGQINTNIDNYDIIDNNIYVYAPEVIGGYVNAPTTLSSVFFEAWTCIQGSTLYQQPYY